jgi:hypothetical protein
MSYQKTVWKNREVERPRTYNIQENEDGTITLIPAEGAIIEPGTPITAQVMQNIEDGIEVLDNTLNSHLAESTAKHIKESGHNANGYYVRFDDGTQICRIDTTIDLSIEGFQSGGVFPAAFYIADIRPAVAWNSYGSLAGGVAEILQKVFLGATAYEWRVYTDGSGTGTQTISLLAIGRWK